MNILKNLKGVDPLRLEIEVAKMEMRWGIIMADVNNYTEAIKSCNNACLIFKRAVSTVPSIQRYYYTALNYLARLYLGTGNYKKAYNVNTEILSFLSKKYELDGKSERKNYASAIANHSLIYIYMKNYSEAESWSQKGLGVDSTDINNKTYYNIVSHQ